MGEFGYRPVHLDVTEPGVLGDLNTGALGAFPRALQLSVTDAQQAFPKQGPSANTVFLFDGIARFGQDAVPHAGEPGPYSDEPGIYEDSENRFDEAIEISDGEASTLYLQLGLSQILPAKVSLGSASVTAVCWTGLDTTGVFGADTYNSLAELTDRDRISFRPGSLPLDFWLFSDVFAEKNCILCRISYQAAVLVQTDLQARSTASEIPIPHAGPVVDLDAANPKQVSTPGALDVGVLNGHQVFPEANAKETANRLLIFTGNGFCDVRPPEDTTPFAAVVRIRLRFAMEPTLLLRGSSTTAALASFHGNDDGPSLFGVNSARVVVDPTDGGTLPKPVPPLPDNELYLLVDVRAAGRQDELRSGVNRIAYQANILVDDTLPDLDAILVSPAGAGTFGPQVDIFLSGGNALYDIQLRLSSPLPRNATLNVTMQSSEPQTVPASPLVVLTQQTVVVANNLVLSFAGAGTVTITAVGRRTSRTATIVISRAA